MDNNFFEEKQKEVMKYRFDEPQKAYNISVDILKYAKDSSNWYEMAYAYLYMGDTLLTMGRGDEAIEYMLKSKNYSERYGYEELLMKNYNILAVTYMVQGDDMLAVENWLLSLELAAKLNDYVYMGALYNNIGALLHNRGDTEGGVPFFKKGIEVTKIHNIKDENLIYNSSKVEINIAAGCIKNDEYIKAKEHLDKAMEYMKDEHYNYSEMIMINVRAMYAHIYIGLGDNGKAYESCKDIINNDATYFEAIEAFDNFIEIADALIEMERYEEAKRLLNIFIEINDREYNATRRAMICEIYIKLCKRINEMVDINYWYEQYYKSSMDIRKERHEGVITALDNRQRLEAERAINTRLQKDNIELIKESEYDELTELRNRYGIKKYFASIYGEAKEKNENICVVMIDVDYFKLYNDTYGHLAGDECLRRVADIIRKSFDGDYYVARYGGDEFFAAAKNKAYEEIDIALMHLINGVMQAKIKFASHPDSDVVTVSAGAVNVVAHEGYEISDFIHEADNMLYKVKENGRKGYCIADNI